MAPRLITTELPDLLPMKRSKGRHISAAIRLLAVRLGHLEDRDEEDEGPQQAYLELGCAWEDGLAYWLMNRVGLNQPDRYVHGIEMWKDDLYGTLDLYDTIDEAVLECKLTKMSSRNNVQSDKFWKWWVQVKAYCYMLGVSTGRLHVCFLNGDYAFLRGEKDRDFIHYRVWEDTWSERELANNWKMLVNAARELPAETR